MNRPLSPISQPSHSQFEAISEFVFSRDHDVPDEALRHCATLLVDTLGVAAGATGLKVGQIARDFAVDFQAAGSDRNAAHMLFDGRRVSLPGAAWALATQIDNLDGHDGFNPVKGHIGCAVVPSLFAFAERRPELSGRDAIQAMVLAYEVAARAGLALHATVTDYHTSGAWNALGVAALGCRLEDLDAGTLREALGIAEYHGPRSQMMREIDNPTMLHDGSGMGAWVGASAVLLAQRGFTGAPAITVEAEDVSRFWQDLGQRWTVAENYIKPYPSCRWGHAAIDALRKVMGKNPEVTPERVSRIEVRTFDEAARLFAGVPETTTQAQYSLHFVLAAMLCHGVVGPRQISDESLNDPAIAAVIPRIVAVSTETHNARFPEGRWSDVEVVLTDGQRIASGDVAASGGPGAWRTDADVEAKFHLFCEGVLSEQRAKKIWEMRDALLDPVCRFADLAELVIPTGDV